MGKPHKHAEFIKRWVDDGMVQARKKEHWAAWGDIGDLSVFDWDNYEFRIKPKREYPETNLSDAALIGFYEMGGELQDRRTSLRRVANAAIRRYIDDQEKAC